MTKHREDALKTELEKENERSKKMETSFKSLKEKQAKEEKLLNEVLSEIDPALLKKGSLADQLYALVDMYQEMKEQNEKLTSNLTDREKQIESQRSQISKLEETNHDQKMTLSELKGDSSLAGNQLEQMQKLMDEMRQNHQDEID